MVVMTPICYASDGSKIYSFAYGHKNSDKLYMVLISSNSNPSPDLSDLTWNIISLVSADDSYYMAETYYSMADCVVDDQGVFSLISQSSLPNDRTAPSKSSPTSVIRGLQYRPSSNGPSGTWANIDVFNSTGYVWDDTIASQLISIKDPGTGANTVMHLTSKDWAQGFYVSILNSANNDSAPMIMTQSALWKVAGKAYDGVNALTYANGKVYSAASIQTPC
ncbi:hypothetical protein BGZ83_011064 [Gryganskiella cystojenkinii]|nr:hypothetical protein BGZ83_011064 [Gryganskiella cystojenkinii]